MCRKQKNWNKYVVSMCNDKVYTERREGGADGQSAHSLLEPLTMHRPVLDVCAPVERNFNRFS